MTTLLLPPPSLPTARELLKESWQVFKNRWRVFLGVPFIAFLGNVAFAVLTGLVTALVVKRSVLKPAAFNNGFIITVIVLGLANIILQLWTTAALMYAIRDRDENVGVRTAFGRAWPKLSSFVSVGLLTALCIFGGFLLLIIPGIIFSIWFCFAPYVLIAEDIKGRKALQRSRQLIRGRWLSAFWRLLIIALVCLIIAKTPGLVTKLTKIGLAEQIGGIAVWFFLTPFATIYGYLLYEAAKQTQPVNHKAV